MTMKIADAAPEEAELVEISDQLSAALSPTSTNRHTGPALDLDASYLEAARAMLATLSQQVSASTSATVPLTRQQIETYLDFDPDFLEVAKSMLRDFINKTETSRRR
jgi:hypothetical protein